jgi:hypothetical protein
MKEKPDGKTPSANGGSVQRMVRRLWYTTLYRPLMRFAHRHHWHYAPPIFPEGDTVFWCKWCGMRDTMNKRSHAELNRNPRQQQYGSS